MDFKNLNNRSFGRVVALLDIFVGLVLIPVMIFIATVGATSSFIAMVRINYPDYELVEFRDHTFGVRKGSTDPLSLDKYVFEDLSIKDDIFWWPSNSVYFKNCKATEEIARTALINLNKTPDIGKRVERG